MTTIGKHSWFPNQPRLKSVKYKLKYNSVRSVKALETMFCYLQDLTKAVEIYKKAADREVKGNQLQLKKAQNNLRDLQDAYNELFLKYKVYFFSRLSY